MNNYFLDTLRHLRMYEEVMLYNNLLHATEQQEQEALAYLKEAYQEESVTYPFQAPAFNGPAAIWAARLVYTAAQLLLHRKAQPAEIKELLPAFPHPITAAALLSADLSLRFLPSIIRQLKAMDPDDPLAPLLEDHLLRWHYSGVNYPLATDRLQLEEIVQDKCLLQLYLDRVIEHRNLALARHPLLIQGIHASLGMFAAVYWKDFAQQATVENDDN